MTRILVVRHGQSEWNAQGRWQGQEDPPLTELGRRQAAQASHAVGAVDAIVASPLQRAATTAAIISEQIGVGPVLTSSDLMERHAGEFQGLTRDEIDVRFPGYLAEERRPPGWEDDAAFERRVFGALDQVRLELPGSEEHRDASEEHRDAMVLAVAHAGVIYAIERSFGADWERLANLGGRWIRHDGDRWHLGDRVHLLIDETIPDQL